MTLAAPDFSIYAQAKIDSHCHVLDPLNFAYADDVAYRPAGQETGSAGYFSQVLAAYGARHALLVGPNSGYGSDNRCLLAAIAQDPQRFKGIGVVPMDASVGQLQDLRAAGVVGIAFNHALHGLAYYAGAAPLMERLAGLNMFVQVQIEKDQMATLAPMLRDCGARLLIDHCGRPDVAAGKGGAGFAAVLALAETGRAWVKLSGYSKFSSQECPWADSRVFVQALLKAYGPQRCLWASDWPFLKAPARHDYGTLLQVFAQCVPDIAARQAILWDTPRQLFGFAPD